MTNMHPAGVAEESPKRVLGTSSAPSAKTLVALLGLLSVLGCSRSPSGTYSLPNGPVVPGTVISSSDENTTRNDLATALSNSLDRTGATGGMTGQLKLAAGSIGAPGAAFSAETTSGLYRAATHDLRMSINSADSQIWSDAGTTINKALSVGAAYVDGTEPDDFSLRVASRIRPIQPASGFASTFPLGHDLWLESNGSADVRLQTWSINLTSTTAVASPGSQTVTVGTSSLLCPSTALDGGNCLPKIGSTALLCAPSECGLEINYDNTDSEFVVPGDWSIASATTLTITFANTHSAPFTIRQIGSVFLDTRTVGINSTDLNDRPVTFIDNNGSPVIILPNAGGGTFPYRAIQINNPLTGINSVLADGGGGDLIYQNRTHGSAIHIIDADNKVALFNLHEAENTNRYDGVMYMSGVHADAGTYNTLTLLASDDIGRIFGGGYNSGLLVFPTSSTDGTGTNGHFLVRDNQGDNNTILDVDTATQLVKGKGFSCTGTGHCGTVQLPASTSTTTPVRSGCRPICTNLSNPTAVRCVVSSTTLTISEASSSSDSINFFCF